MKFLIVVVSCLAVANASAIWAHGHHGALVGASGVVSAHGASGPSGVVTGHGAVGPQGDHSAHGHYAHGHVAHVYGHGHDDGQWHGEGLLESQDWANHHHGVHGAAIIAPHSAKIVEDTNPVPRTSKPAPGDLAKEPRISETKTTSTSTVLQTMNELTSPSASSSTAMEIEEP
ncbi:hypothetical protein RN001_007298 [Aquatica leii]|uniref:Uncharacterized protein n=1 Tax=Aquatica leii TaxID=1421715 RepID=A0AAN7SF81_9COLE|nr:hypothetical protein RN001_007298 [Aquatica leii]